MTLIIGRNSNLSKVLSDSIENSFLINSEKPVTDLDEISFKASTKINIIFNNFQKSTMLYNLDNPVEYMQRAIMTTAEVLSYFINKNIGIQKVIYTSSSSVYGNNIFCTENDPLMPMSLPASLKITNEKMIEIFCKENQIDYTICRLFNMYGGDDEFSIVSKIINAARYDKKLTLFNNGNAIRDFIHIDDVVRIYDTLLDTYNIPIVNVGTSNGVSIKSILDFLVNKNIIIEYESFDREELKVSTANIDVLKSIIDISFYDVQVFILDEILKVKNK